MNWYPLEIALSSARLSQQYACLRFIESENRQNRQPTARDIAQQFGWSLSHAIVVISTL